MAQFVALQPHCLLRSNPRGGAPISVYVEKGQIIDSGDYVPQPFSATVFLQPVPGDAEATALLAKECARIRSAFTGYAGTTPVNTYEGDAPGIGSLQTLPL